MIKLFKTQEEKEIEQLEKQQYDINQRLNMLHREPVTLIKHFIENQSIEVVSIKKEPFNESIDVRIKKYNGYRYLPLQTIAEQTGYFVTSFMDNWSEYGDEMTISFASFKEIKRREALPPNY